MEPSIDAEESEATGITLVEFALEDTRGDSTDVRVEYDLGDGQGWRLARPAGEDPTPEFAFSDVLAGKGRTQLDFFWDTSFDLGDADTDAIVRFVPFEDVEGILEEGAPLASDPFHVDNNEEPIVQLFNDQVVTNPDERRGIPVPFKVLDEEGDPVQVLLQWRLPDEGFPALPEDGATLDAILADPVLRREHHICTPYPRCAQGRVLPVDATSVRLPELALGESWILASGLEGKTLELLRPSSIPGPVTRGWSADPLVSPVAAIPLRDGLTALVLDVPGSARLREIELATGAVLREVATLGPGIPSAMAKEPFEAWVLIATDMGGLWRVERVDLATGVVTELRIAGGAPERGPIRGLAILGTDIALGTIGSSLVMLDHADPLATRAVTLLTDLSTPWGIAIHPLDTNRVYLSERDAVTGTGRGRVLAVELDSFAKLPVVVQVRSVQDLEEPSAIAFARDGARLLAVASDPGGRRLVGLDLGGRGGNAPFAIGPPISGEPASVATGPENLLLLAVPSENELWIGGGLEQRRTIEAFEPQLQQGEPRRQLVTLESPASPPARAGQSWRIPVDRQGKAKAEGVDMASVWDSTDVPGRAVFLRAIPRDGEQGAADAAAVAKTVRASLDVSPLVLASPSASAGPVAIAAADLDGDGDQDLVSANLAGDNLGVWFQGAPGDFSPGPELGGPSLTSGPVSVATGDLDGDGDQDLVSANRAGNDLRVFFQTAPGSFVPGPGLGDSSITGSPVSIAVADLDGDGDQDLVSANFDGDDLTVFFQRPPGSFDPTPLSLNGSSTTAGPASIAAGDLDGDGDLDLVSANTDSDDLTVFFQRIPGSFDPIPLSLGTSSTSGPSSVAVADLDGDGDLDLVGGSSGRSVDIFFQGSPGSFDPSALSLEGSPGSRLDSITAADLDGDGDRDLVMVDPGRDELIVFFQTTPGGFDPTPLTLDASGGSSGSGPASVVAADLDGDGDPDLVSANTLGDNLTVFFQRSPGSFDPSPLSLGGPSTTKGPFSVAAADLDGDGDQDLVSANHDGDDLGFFFQSSPGRFDPGPASLSINNPSLVVTADLDNDGDPDLVSASLFGHTLRVFFQSSPGSFDPRSLALGGPSITDFPKSVAAADIDGDGDTDLVSANHDGDDLTVFWGGR